MGGIDATVSTATAGRRAQRSELDAAFAAVRDRLALIAILLAMAVVAWLTTADRMAGMDAGPGSDLGALGWFIGVWLVMMAAMMFPSLAPTVALYSKMTKRRGPARPLLFTTGYLLVWGTAGLGAYGLFELGTSIFGGDLAWRSGGRWLAAGVLVVAAVYELTPLKNVCLAKCRSPLGFLIGTWRDGRLGAVQMGSRHAGWCLGCCWALMAALFALGAMSLSWMAFVAALITLEKTIPWRRAATIATTAVLLALAIMFIAEPDAIPGLVVPDGSHNAMSTMKAMPG